MKQYRTVTPLHPLVALVASESGISVADITSKRRDRVTTTARVNAVYVLDRQLVLSYAGIGRLLNLHHTSILAIRDRLDRDPTLRARAEDTRQRIVAMASMAVGS